MSLRIVPLTFRQASAFVDEHHRHHQGWTVYAERAARKGWDAPIRPRRGNGNDGIERTLWEVSA